MIDGMILAEAEEIFAYWAESPPAHLMVQVIAAMLGWKPKRPADLAEIAAAPPPGMAVVRDGGAGMPAPIFDIDTLRALNRARAAAVE
ncbi:MAG TPA: hypothetical protein VHW66_21570 [Stellaceae bacterium]|nr:hypothetical protein [Stellaceae bacterium]